MFSKSLSSFLPSFLPVLPSFFPSSHKHTLRGHYTDGMTLASWKFQREVRLTFFLQRVYQVVFDDN